MALPKLKHPTFEIEVPTLQKKLMFRPFLVAEEKILLIAQQSGDLKEMILSLKQVIGNCCLDETFDANKLATFDIEYVFLKLRARSVSNKADVYLTDNEDGKEYKFSVDLDEVQLVRDPNHDPRVQLTDTIGVVLKYPTVDMVDVIAKMQVETEAFFEVMRYCIDYVTEGSSIHKFSDSTLEEQNEFLASIDIEGFTKITRFFETMPKMSYEINYKNSLGNDRKTILRNLNDFFILG